MTQNPFKVIYRHEKKSGTVETVSAFQVKDDCLVKTTLQIYDRVTETCTLVPNILIKELTF